MKKIKWYGWCAAALILILAAYFLFRPGQGGGTYDNLIVNGDFEVLDEQGLPAGWYTYAYNAMGQTEFSVSAEGENHAAHIRSVSPNDSRFSQIVSVSPDTLYCLHGYVKADALGGWGANLSIENVNSCSVSSYSTEGEWLEISYYGRTGKNQRSLTVSVRLGGYSSEATGEAFFDDITLCRVDSVPGEYYTALWDAQPVSQTDDSVPENRTGSVYLVLGCLGYAALFAALAKYWLRPCPHDLKKKKQEKGRETLSLLAVLAAALAARIAVAALVPGYDVDISCFRGWSDMMASFGPERFYELASFCDYPPGYLWILWYLGGLGNLFHTGVTELMVKIPPILADLALCAVLYAEAKKHLPAKSALALCILYAFNPFVFVTGAAWGQVDSLMVLLLFLVVLYALRGQWKTALPLYMAAVLFKPQALMFGPLGLAAFAGHLIRQGRDPRTRKEALRDAWLGLRLLFAVALVIVLPFSVYQPWNWLITLYGKTMGQYGYATVNSCNLYFLLGKNWVGAQSSLQGDGLVPVIAYCLATLPLLAAWLLGSPWAEKDWGWKKNRLRICVLGGLALLLAAALMILGWTGQMTYSSLGTCMIVYSVALFAALYILGGDPEHLPLLGAGLLILLFNTGSMMHERYLFPAAALLLLAYIRKKDKRILYLALGITLTGLLNVGCALDRNIRIGGAEGHLSAPACAIQSDMAGLEYLAAAANCLLCGLSLTLSSLLCREGAQVQVWNGRTAENESLPKRSAPLPLSRPPRKMTGKDWAVMLTATALYAALTFTNLGSLKAPQTAWVSSAPGEKAVLDLGEEHSFHLLYFPGIHNNPYSGSSEMPATFTVETSLDGEQWDQAASGSAYNGDCFKWKYLFYYPVTGRYVRITATDYSLTLFELLFRDAETGEALTAALVSDSADNETAAALIDEPDTLEGEPGWYNSTYFDEIYHARTAYEHLHGINPYETTHPPLGKVFMSWAVAIFGMVPFGWRFAGALAGVLMLPGMYLLGKLLIRKKWGGAGAMLLMALDLMHFTQTRIATIDSFVVLFIIWMVYFMLRWFFLDFFRMPFWKTLVPLALSGLMMGLGIASKWTGCYAGAGLAVIFFFGIWRRYRLVRAAKRIPPGKQSADDARTADGARYLLITLASCLVFFVAVPLLIYYLSYIPYFAPRGGVTVERVIEAALGMFSYHSTPGLGMDHSFYSPWYQWPIIGKPMWYASSGYEPAGMQSSIMAMGNPAVWWTGLAGLLGVMGLWVRRHLQSDYSLSLHTEDDDPRFPLLLICFAAQYLPWVLVPRGTYIYHYFPCVPFIILCTILCLDKWAEKHEKAAGIALWVLVALAAILFAAFFPYASGVTVSQQWMDAMRWFPNWLWY